MISELREIHDYLWHGPNPKNSLLESNGVSKKTLFFFRISAAAYCAWLCTWRRLAFEEMKFYEDFKFLTVWGLILATAFYFFTMLEYLKVSRIFSLNWKIAHVLFEVAFSLQFTITVFFWTAVFPTCLRLGESEVGFKIDLHYIILTANMHGGVFIVLWIDNILNKIRFYKRHMYFLIAFSIFYCILNILYTVADEPVYIVLDWKSISSYFYALLASGLSMFHFYIGYIFYLRMKSRKDMEIDGLYFAI
jgi:hypothetical protein